MKFEDAQIDLLLARHGRRSPTSANGEHLDADELNAFAYGAAPAAARSRYVSHLADCDECRKLATQLSMAVGAAARTAAGPIESVNPSWWQKLSVFIAPSSLRYAAFAAVLIATISVTFIALRNRRESSLVASNEAPADRQAGAVQSRDATAASANHQAQDYANPSGQLPQPQQNARDETRSQPADTLSLPKPAKEAAGQEIPAAKKAGEPAVATDRQPSYAPPPPSEAAARAQTNSRREDERVFGGVAAARKTEESDDRLRQTDLPRAVELSKDQRTGGPYQNKSANNQQTANQTTQSNTETTRPTFNRAVRANETGAEAKSKPATSPAKSDADKAPETRSAGGHKFRRQGGAWVDVKFKSSMAVTNVSRGSDEFLALDSDLRAIAGQIGGEVIIVRKGKAYRIK